MTIAPNSPMAARVSTREVARRSEAEAAAGAAARGESESSVFGGGSSAGDEQGNKVHGGKHVFGRFGRLVRWMLGSSK
jgi:hypothetical protein